MISKKNLLFRTLEIKQERVEVLVVRALVVTIVMCGMRVYLPDQRFHRISHSGRISMIPCVTVGKQANERAHKYFCFCKISFNTLRKFSLTFSGQRRMGLSIDRFTRLESILRRCHFTSQNST